MDKGAYETIKGTVESVVFHNADNGFTVLEFDRDGELVTVVGEFPDINVGDGLSVTGLFTVHANFGTQFKAVYHERLLPTGAAAIRKYLSSGVIKGIGKTLANRIVDTFGDRALDVIERSPGELLTIPGITEKKLMVIEQEFRMISGIRRLMLYLQPANVKPEVVIRIWKRYGVVAVDMIKENPYSMCDGDIGLDFDIADAIAEGVGMSREHPERLAAGVRFVLKHNLGNGHTCIPYEKLCILSTDKLYVDRELVEASIEGQTAREELFFYRGAKGTFVYLPRFYKAEKYIAMKLTILMQNKEHFIGDIEHEIERLEREQGIVYEDKQRNAIRLSSERGVMILTGGPGTGKTTILKAIINIAVYAGQTVAVGAPTGRAAKRASELTGCEAKTIHRLLESEQSADGTQSFRKDEKNPLNCDLIVVDELSMVDVLLFEALLRAVRLGSRIVLVGDSNQLPPVGAGCVMKDLIDSGAVETVELGKVFRQAAESLIVTNAHEILAGNMPVLNARDRDFFFITQSGNGSIAEKVVELYKVRLPGAYGYEPLRDIQVLCPTRIGELGTVELNKRLQANINPPGTRKNEFKYGDIVFREGDKVMQNKNNYDILWTKGAETGMGIFNGDMGIVTNIDRQAGLVTISFDERVSEYTKEMLSEVEHAFAVTVHKSQGSEFPVVILPLTTPNPKLYYRSLLYTGVTRAKSQLIIIGHPAHLQYMVDNNKKSLRYTCLAEFLNLAE